MHFLDQLLLRVLIFLFAVSMDMLADGACFSTSALRSSFRCDGHPPTIDAYHSKSHEIANAVLAESL